MNKVSKLRVNTLHSHLLLQKPKHIMCRHFELHLILVESVLAEQNKIKRKKALKLRKSENDYRDRRRRTQQILPIVIILNLNAQSRFFSHRNNDGRAPKIQRRQQ